MSNIYNPLDEQFMNIPEKGEYLDVRDNGKIHHGIDYSAPIGTDIYSSTDGWVICSGITGGYGNTIVVQHRDGTSTLYGHMKNLSSFEVGDYIGVRETIGEVGNTGASRGSHLHFEHIDKDGSNSIKKYSGNGYLGLLPGTHRLNPHKGLKDIGGKFIWHYKSQNRRPCQACLEKNGNIYTYGLDIEPPLHLKCDCWIEDYNEEEKKK